MELKRLFLVILLAWFLMLPGEGFSEEGQSVLSVSGRWELGIKTYIRDVGDSPFNQTNVLSISTNEEYIVNSFELKLSLYDFFYGYLKMEGVYGLEKVRLVTTFFDFLPTNEVQFFDDHFNYWSFTEWKGEFCIYGVFLGVGKTLFSPSPAKVFKVVDLQNRVFGGNKLQVWLNWAVEDYFFRLSYAPRDSDIPKFFEHLTNSLEGEDMVYVEAGGMVGTFEVGVDGFWDTNFGVGLWVETSLGDRATVYSQFSAMDKAWILKPDLESKKFRLSKSDNFDVAYRFSLGGGYHFPEMLGTLYVEGIYNIGGLNENDWESYRRLSEDLRASTGFDVYHAISEYVKFLLNFRPMEYSLMYLVLHWQVDATLLEGFDAGISFVWSYPSDFLLRFEVKYNSTWGFFVDGEGIVMVPNGGEFSFLPAKCLASVYLGWAYDF